jgi:hypothetical protein
MSILTLERYNKKRKAKPMFITYYFVCMLCVLYEEMRRTESCWLSFVCYDCHLIEGVHVAHQLFVNQYLFVTHCLYVERFPAFHVFPFVTCFKATAMCFLLFRIHVYFPGCVLRMLMWSCSISYTVYAL